MARIGYARGPLVYLYDRETRSRKRRQLLWGDWLRLGDDLGQGWSEVHWGRETLAIHEQDVQSERLLELIFLDVGQGDGCILTTPETGRNERIMIIDAGLGRNMNGYLEYRFRDFKSKFRFHAAVLTHPDADHYRGFQPIFENEQISFEHVYHNGILERTGDDGLGPVEDGALTDIRASRSAARELYSNSENRGRKWYPELIWTALGSDRFGDISMLSTMHGTQEGGRAWMPGFAPSNNDELTIEILGPVPQRRAGGKIVLPVFGDDVHSSAFNTGKTKNGHSILLRLQYRDFTILFGGDLNSPAEHYLMRHYGNDGEAPTTAAEMDAMIAKARRRFAADLMKACHHGSSDVTDEFLEATKPLAYVVSSGDEESHVHPRPDLLGLLGKKGRGPRPLILSTEMQRSTREREDEDLRRKLDRLKAEREDTEDSARLAEIDEAREEILDEVFKRNVGVYGAINLRTDGRKAVIAFRKERTRGTSRWFAYELEKDAQGIFQLRREDGH